MSRRSLFGIAAAIALVATTVGAGMAFAGSGHRQSGPIGGGGSISTRGAENMEPNQLVYSTFHFSPEKAVVTAGQHLRWVHRDESEDPHTATIVTKDQLPTTADEAFNCKVCQQALRAHFAGGKLHRKVDVGHDGLSGPGDSLLFGPGFNAGEDVTAKVTARPGTTLYYLCAIHPWMQGRIVVR